MRFSSLAAIILTAFIIFPVSANAESIRFGVPAWPGVTVKSEVVCQILESIGYETEQMEVGAPILYKGLTTGEIDAYLASWIPLQSELYQPLKEKNALDTVAVNLDEAGSGLSVSKNAWDAGVRSIADLDKFADKFDHKIYGIEIGAGLQISTQKIIDNNVAGLGDWQQVNSTTSVMLATVQDMIRRGEWVVFHGWQPHWMTLKIDMGFLEGGVPGSEDLISKSIVYTLAHNDFKNKFPQPYKFLKQFYIKGDTQSLWIYEFGFKKQDPKDVATNWISNNLDTVTKWLDGVKAADGTPAAEVVRKDFQ